MFGITFVLGNFPYKRWQGTPLLSDGWCTRIVSHAPKSTLFQLFKSVTGEDKFGYIM